MNAKPLRTQRNGGGVIVNAQSSNRLWYWPSGDGNVFVYAVIKLAIGGSSKIKYKLHLKWQDLVFRTFWNYSKHSICFFCVFCSFSFIITCLTRFLFPILLLLLDLKISGILRKNVFQRITSENFAKFNDTSKCFIETKLV